jgi:hypothetical protein
VVVGIGRDFQEAEQLHVAVVGRDCEPLGEHLIAAPIAS